MAIQVQVPNAKPDSQGPNYQVHWFEPVILSSEDSPHARFGIRCIDDFRWAKYELPEGESAEGMTCEVTFDEGLEITLGLGSVFSSGGCQWEVVGIDEAIETMTIKRA